MTDDAPVAESAGNSNPERDYEIRRAIEAILMVADQPVDPSVLAQLLEVPADDVVRLCGELADEYASQSRGFILHKVAGGYRYQTHVDLAPYVERFVLDGQVARLSAAALETLAIVAYKQPISRNQVSAIRGVGCDAVMRTLEARAYIEEESRDPGPGRAVLYGTTDLFLERLGIDSLDDLPPLGQFVPNADVVEALETTLMVTPDAVADGAEATPDADEEGEGTEAAAPSNGTAPDEVDADSADALAADADSDVEGSDDFDTGDVDDSDMGDSEDDVAAANPPAESAVVNEEEE